MSTKSLCAGALCLSALAGLASAGAAPRVVMSTIDGHPSAQVPGRPGMVFRNLWRPYASPSGAEWAMRANNAFFDSGSMLVIGQGLTVTAPLAQFDPAPWAPGESISTVDEQMGVNSAGQVAFSVNTNDGASPNDEYVLRLTNGAYEVVAQEGDPVAAIPGATLGVILDETHILSDGTVAFRCTNAGGLPTNSNTMLLRGATVMAREGVTVPLGQAGGGSAPWELFDFYGYSSSPSGSVWMGIGDVGNGGTGADNIVTVNNAVRVQEGVQLFPFVEPPATTPSGFCKGHVAPSGDWFVRGTNSGSGQDWVRRNGDVVTATGRAIVEGQTTEAWSDAIPNTHTFFLHTANSVGDYVVGGWTNGPAGQNAVVVLNSEMIVLRRGAELDFDGDGAGDGYFLADFENDKGLLTPDRRLMVVVKVQDAGATLDPLTKALIVVQLPARVCPADLDGDGTVSASDLASLLGSWGEGGAADLDGSGEVTAADLAALLGSWGPCE